MFGNVKIKEFNWLKGWVEGIQNQLDNMFRARSVDEQEVNARIDRLEAKLRALNVATLQFAVGVSGRIDQLEESLEETDLSLKSTIDELDMVEKHLGVEFFEITEPETTRVEKVHYNTEIPYVTGDLAKDEKRQMKQIAAAHRAEGGADA